jgi:DNA primase
VQGDSAVILNSRAADGVVVEGIAQRQRVQRLLEQVRVITHRALLAPVGKVARETLAAWGLPEPSLDHLDIGYFPDPAFLAWELNRRDGLAPPVEGAGLLEPSWSGRVVGPWRNLRGRIVTFFAWQPDSADRSERYVCGPAARPCTLFGHSAATSQKARHVCVVEGLLDVLLASCLGMDDVLGLGGPMWRLSAQQLTSMATGGIREVTIMPADDEEGRLGVLTVLENADHQRYPAVDVFVVDPALMWGARDLGELVRKRGERGLAEVRASRMEDDVYRIAMVPW